MYPASVSPHATPSMGRLFILCTVYEDAERMHECKQQARELLNEKMSDVRQNHIFLHNLQGNCESQRVTIASQSVTNLLNRNPATGGYIRPSVL